MILATPAYVLAQSVPAYTPRIGYQTWVRDRSLSDISVSTATTNGPKDAPLRDNGYEFWQGSALPATWRIDLGQARAVDYIGLAGHTIGDESATAKWEYSSDDTNWTQFGGNISPVNNAPLVWLDSEVTKRYWRLTLSGSGDVPQVANIYLGQALAMQRAVAGGHRPGRLGREVVQDDAFSEGGKFLGATVVRQGVRGSFRFEKLTAGWYDDNFDPAVVTLIRYPAFWLWSPVDYPNDVVFGKPTETIVPDRRGPGRGLVSVSFEVRGEGHGD